MGNTQTRAAGPAPPFAAGTPWWFRRFCDGPADAACPSERSGHVAVCSADGFLYVIGGFSAHPRPEAFAEVWRLHIVSGVWQRVECDPLSFPRGLLSQAAAMVGTRTLLVFGGTRANFSEDSSDELCSFDLRTHVWTRHAASGAAPSPRYGASLTLLGDACAGEALLFGGTNGHEFFADLRLLNVQTLEWTHIERPESSSEPWPMRRYRHTATYAHGSLWVVGGGSSTVMGVAPIVFSTNERGNLVEMVQPPRDGDDEDDDGQQANVQPPAGPISLWRLCLATHKWSPVQAHGRDGLVPEPRLCHTAVYDAARNALLVHGGTDRFMTVFDELWALDLGTCEWRLLNDAPRYSLHYAVTELPGALAALELQREENVAPQRAAPENALDACARVINEQELPPGLFFHTLSPTPWGSLACFGGCIDLDVTGNPTGRTNGWVELWLDAPSLRELCLRCVAANAAALGVTHDGLVRLGVPAEAAAAALAAPARAAPSPPTPVSLD